MSMAGFCYLKLTLDTPRGILSRMTDSTAFDRSRFYSVAELAQEFSLTSQGIRFYEESGLISPARVGRTRVFNYQDRARLILIQRLRRLGFSLDAIREYLSLYKADVTGGPIPARARAHHRAHPRARGQAARSRRDTGGPAGARGRSQRAS